MSWGAAANHEAYKSACHSGAEEKLLHSDNGSALVDYGITASEPASTSVQGPPLRRIDESSSIGGLHALVKRQAAEQTGSVAVHDIEANIKLTYGDVIASADALAAQLQFCSIGTLAVVVLLLSPSASLVVATLALMQVGAAWAPLDSKSPKDRLRSLIIDVIDAQLVFSAASMENESTGVEHMVPIWKLKPDGSVDQQQSVSKSAPMAKDTEVLTAASAIFCTSGSTGRPKAVAYSQETLLHGVLCFQEMCSCNRSTVSLLKCLPSWAVVEYELFPTLISGGLLLAHGQCQANVQLLAEVLGHHQVSVLVTSGQVLRVLIDGPWSVALESSLRHVVNVGDALKVAVCLDLQRLLGPDILIHNLYGCTESPCTRWTIQQKQSTEAAVNKKAIVPAGVPQPEVQLHILDKQLKPVSPGEVGEVCFAGKYLSLGYLHDQELTAAKFMDNPFCQGRLYRTGDLGKWITISKTPLIGYLELVGRADRQMNLRGIRTSPEEIESVIMQLSCVHEVAVVMVSNDEGGAIVACVSGNSGDLAAQVETHCAALLPKQVCPAVTLSLPQLPKLRNGKFDLRALQADALEAFESAPKEAMDSLGLMQKMSKEAIMEQNTLSTIRAVATMSVVIFHDYVWYVETFDGIGPLWFRAVVRGFAYRSNWSMYLFALTSAFQDTVSRERHLLGQTRQDIFVFVLLLVCKTPFEHLFQFINVDILQNSPCDFVSETGYRWYLAFFLKCRILHYWLFIPMALLPSKLSALLQIKAFRSSWAGFAVRLIFASLFTYVFVRLAILEGDEDESLNVCRNLKPGSNIAYTLGWVFVSSDPLDDPPWCSPLWEDLEGYLLAAYALAWWLAKDVLHCMAWPFRQLPQRYEKRMRTTASGMLLVMAFIAQYVIGVPDEDDGWDTGGFKMNCIDFVLAGMIMVGFAGISERGHKWFVYFGFVFMGRYSLGAYILNSTYDLSLIVGDHEVIPGIYSAVGRTRNWAGGVVSLVVLLAYTVIFMLTLAPLFQIACIRVFMLGERFCLLIFSRIRSICGP